jgi:NADPH-dependent 2,4-dienoyl-CoA reductase/sulfur reductase-like enzyme
MEQIVIVGASLAGVRAAEVLRREGHTGPITLVGRETHFPPVDRPPLSKELLSGEWSLERGRLRVADDLDATLRLGVAATSLELGAQVVGLSDGTEIGFDGLIIATGASPRTLAGIDPELPGVFVIRTFEDCVALRGAFESRPRVTVVGAGFIGAEVAAVCRGLGLSVTVCEPMRYPMERAIGPVVGEWAAELHRSHGVDLRLETAVVAARGTDRVEALVLGDGTEIPTDIVIVAVGVAPNVAWLEGSGLLLDNGVVCDETLRAVDGRHIVAAGDVARWPNPAFGRLMRIEHWANAVEQAQAAARTLLSGPRDAEPFSSVPYFWSNQYDKRIQYVGIPGTFTGIVEGSIDEPKFVATFELDGRLVGALCVNSPARMAKYRGLIASGADIKALDEVVP